MTDVTGCEDYARQDVARRYVARVLDPTEVEAFEVHFLTCAWCREAVAFADAARAAARALPVGRASRRSRSARWLAGASLSIAAGIAVVAIVRARASRGVEELGALSRPPEYRGVQIRAKVTTADSLFHDGMVAYSAQRYDDAVRLLRASVVARATATDANASVPANFFLGASLLVQREAALAADAFARVEAVGWSPYRDEAHYYRALALLQTGNLDAGVAELRMASAGANHTAALARDLLARLERR